MNIAKGMTFGPYEIVSHIGEGGMGEVWRARDPRIGRDVAVKVLPDGFMPGDERLWRFEQEARAAGALNHPGLVTIFDVGTIGSAPYIVMELLEGKTMRDVIGDPDAVALPQKKAIEYAIQIASALAVAHDKGIIHRDLKPENIFVTTEGRVKILDFGLAKLAESTQENGAGVTALRQRHTAAGIALGTPAYMSPEQVRAQPIDHRTDIFSFGSVLYEMLSGRPAFDFMTAIEAMQAVLHTDPTPLTDLDPRISPTLEAIVMRCLEKNPRDRFQSAGDLAFHLRTLPEIGRNATATPHQLALPGRRRLPYRAAAVILPLLLAAGAGGFVLSRWGKEPTPVVERTYRQLTFAGGVESFPALAPDGKSFAYVSSQSGNRDIFVQRVDGRMAFNLTKDSPDDDSQPVFSPDGSQIAFRSERDGGGIFVMGATGESTRRLTNFGYNPSWSPDGTRIVVSTQVIELRPHIRPLPGGLSIVDTRTQATRVLLRDPDGRPDPKLPINDAVQPSWSPNGKRIAFWGVTSYPGGDRHIWTIDPDAKKPLETLVRVTKEPALYWNPVWSPDGQYLYFGSDRDGTVNLWRIAVDQTSGEAKGTPEPLSLAAPFSGNFSFSQNGEMAYTAVTREYRLLAFPFDQETAKTGEPRVVFGGSEDILSFEASPDGQKLAFTTGGMQEDLFVVDVPTGRLTQLTNDAARDRGVSWSRDGKSLYVFSNRDGLPYHIWTIRADGSGLTRVTDDGDVKRNGTTNPIFPNASPDGRTLAAQAKDGILVHLDRPITKRIEPVASPARLLVPKWSPDGRRLLGGLAGSGFGVYTIQSRRFEESLDRGVAPHWLPDGRRVVFFEERHIGVFDLASKSVTTSPFAAPTGVELTAPIPPRISSDGSTLYVRQVLEQGDIWIARFNKQDEN